MEHKRRTIRSGYVPVLIYTPVILAREKGYYQAHGIEVELARLPTGKDIVPNLLSGRFDIAVGGPGPDFWQAIAEGYDIHMLAPMHAERPPAATPLIVRSDLFDSGEVDTVSDLKGRAVATPSQGAPLFWLASALESGGLTIDDVALQVVPYTEVGQAFERQEIDAALLGEPLVTNLIEHGIAARLASDFVDGLQPTYLFALGSTIEEHRDDVVRFIAGYLQACADLQSDDPTRGWSAPATIQTIAEFTDIQPDEIAESTHPSYEPEAEFREGSIERLYEFFISRNVIRPIPNFKPASLIDRSLANEALDLLRAKTGQQTNQQGDAVCITDADEDV